MDTLKFAHIKKLLPGFFLKYYTTDESLLEDILRNIKFLKMGGDYVQKGEEIIEVMLHTPDNDAKLLKIHSPYTGFIEYTSLLLWDINFDRDLLSFYQNECDLYFPFRLKTDITTDTTVISWHGIDSEFEMNSNEKHSCTLDFNIKSNAPCLHFKYQGFHLNINDNLYFINNDGNQIAKFVVVKKEHIYKNKIKEVDFILSHEDITALKNCQLSHLLISFANEDRPITLRNLYCKKYETINEIVEPIGLSFDGPEYNNYEINCERAPYYKAFHLYISAYCKALDELGILYHEKSRQLFEDVKYDYCYVYLMYDKRNGYYKIGISKEPKYREKTLQSEQPNIEMVCSKRYPLRKIAEAFESALHKTYAEKRIRGEWFNLSNTDILILKECFK